MERAISNPSVGDRLTAAAAVGDWGLAIQVMDSWSELFHNHPDQLLEFLEFLPEEILDLHPRLRLARDHVHARFRGIRNSRAYRDNISIVSNSAPIDRLAALTGQVAVARNAGRIDEAASKADQAVAYLAALPVEVVPSLANALPDFHYQWGLTFEQSGRVSEALDQYLSSFDWAESTGHRSVMTIAAGGAAYLHALAGRGRDAEVWLERIPVESGRVWWSSYAPVPALIAAALIHHDRLDATEASKLITLVDPDHIAAHWGAYFFVKALVSSTFQNAQDLLAELGNYRAQVPVSQRRLMMNEEYVALTRHVLYSRLGLPSRAARILRNDEPGETASVLRQLAALYQAMHLINVNQPRAARRLCAPLTRVSGSQPRILIPALLLVAETGVQDQVAAIVIRVASLAKANSKYADLLIASAPTRSLVVSRLELLDDAEMASRIRLTIAPDGTIEKPGLEALTRREKVVVENVLAGFSTAEIAERLRVSTNTVKTQRRSAYRKLDVGSREHLRELFALDR